MELGIIFVFLEALGVAFLGTLGSAWFLSYNAHANGVPECTLDPRACYQLSELSSYQLSNYHNHDNISTINYHSFQAINLAQMLRSLMAPGKQGPADIPIQIKSNPIKSNLI